MTLENALFPTSQLYQTLVDESSQGITVADLKGGYIFVNPAFCQIMGYSEVALLNMNMFDIKAPKQDDSPFEQTISVKENQIRQVLLQRKDGSTFMSEVVERNINIDGSAYVFCTIQDISKRIAIEQTLINNEKRNCMVMQIANDGIWSWHLNTNTVEFDERYYTMAGYEKDAFPASVDEWLKRVHADDIAHITHNVESYLAGKSAEYDVEFRFLRKNNTYMWIRGKGEVVESDSTGKPLRFIGTHSDISIQKEHEEKILHQAHFDSLTFLPNRFLSLDRLELACEEAKRNNELVALLFLDLDDFKKVNDTLGHDVGDQLLIDAANRLRKVIRSVDTVGRLGGDEFIIILGGLKKIEEAQPIVENLLNQFRKIFVINARELLLTTSVGIAIYPNDASDASELLRNADSAMYDAKESGRNTYSYYTAKMNQCAQRRLAIEEQLHGALARNEFSVHYQPKIDLASARIMGAEALLRWHNPVLGNVPPDEFISVAEQTGAIIPLGQFVLKQAVKQTAIWQKNFDDSFQIAVNLSPRQFRDLQLINVIKQTLNETNITSGSLELEITEGVLLSGHGQVREVLNSITNLGIKMAMDDFGTGYSSLSYLRTYPFDVLKIDRSFINDMTSNSKDKALINAVIAMSHALNLKVVAEGIETKQQYELLRTLGCDYGQGYLFSKPLTTDDMTTLLRDTRSMNYSFEL
ncbi:MAG: EAL domain-containing protein [Colwellia sp.]|nr:EAL domain-containing protein [Colwellia sp.]